jgi:RimJ/RimL family protein N-acetyltransferase
VIAAERDLDNRAFIIPWSRDRHAASFGDPDIVHAILHHDHLGRAGFLIVAGLTDPHGNLELRRLVVTAKRRGFGRAAVRLVQQLAFVEQHARRLWLDVKERNQRARWLYESEGFVVEVAPREPLEDEEEFDSLVVMSMLAPEHGEARPGPVHHPRR